MAGGTSRGTSPGRGGTVGKPGGCGRGLTIPTHRFQVSAATTERIDRFLADQLQLSRSQVGRLIAAKAVHVNGEAARASRVLQRADLVEVVVPETTSPPRRILPYDHPLVVVFEDDHLLVIDKPAGLVVHPAPGHWDDTLLNALVSRGTSLSQEGARPGIVHRLDRDTSGLMIVAKTDHAHRVLARQLAQRRISRVYAALVWGHLTAQVDVDAPVARHPTDRKRMAVLAGGRSARTRLHPLARFSTCDLIRAELETGRTHQIRVHCAHIGHPVVGDRIYSGGGPRRMTGSQRPEAERLDHAVPRHALHAATLRFHHPETGAPMVLRSEWPEDLRPGLAIAADDARLLDSGEPLSYLGFHSGDG